MKKRLPTTPSKEESFESYLRCGPSTLAEGDLNFPALHLMTAIEPETYDLLFGYQVTRAYEHASALLAATEEAVEAVFAQYTDVWVDNLLVNSLYSFFRERFALCQEQHGALPFADHRKPELFSRQLHLNEEDSGRPLNPPPTQLKGVASIYEITPEDMKARAAVWLQAIVNFIGVPDSADKVIVAKREEEAARWRKAQDEERRRKAQLEQEAQLAEARKQSRWRLFKRLFGISNLVAIGVVVAAVSSGAEPLTLVTRLYASVSSVFGILS